MTRFSPSAILLGTLLLLTSCAGNIPTNTDAKLTVAASFYPLAFLAEQIGGDVVHVTQVTPGGVEPHDYDPAPEQLRMVHDAKIVLMNGGGVDPWADKIRSELDGEGIKTVKMGELVSLLDAQPEEGEPTGTFDPHIWLDPVRMQQMTVIIRDTFIAADPPHADVYRKNAGILLAKLRKLDTDYRSGLRKCTITDVVVSHNAFRYLADRYGFSTLALSGLSPEEEPSPQKIAAIAEIAKSHHVKVIFFETLISPKLAQTVAEEIGATPMVLNPLEGLTPEDVSQSRDYLSIMEENLQHLRTALQCP